MKRKTEKKGASAVSKEKASASASVRRKNPLLIIAAAVVCLGIAVGTVLGVVSCVASMNAVMEYEGVRLDKKVASYLVSLYKNTYIAEIKATGVGDAEDKESFWQRSLPDGELTYAEHFETCAEQYLRGVVAGAYLYDRYAEMSDKVEDAVKTSAAKRAEYYYNTEGYDALFKADAAEMGYDYDAYEKAAILLYKYAASCDALFGSDGSGVAEYISDCNEYLKTTYTHVEFLFIRTNTTFAVDASGERLKNADGTYMMRDLSAKEKGDREAKIAEAKALIDDYNKGGSTAAERISPVYIHSAAKEFGSDQSLARIEKGYYFHSGSEYYKSLEVSPELKLAFDRALSLELDASGNAYSYITLSLADENGSAENVECFMYKSAVADNAYADVDLYDFFTDFYAGAANHVHGKLIKELSAEVEVKERFYEMEVALIPKNDKHKINEFSGV